MCQFVCPSWVTTSLDYVIFWHYSLNNYRLIPQIVFQKKQTACSSLKFVGQQRFNISHNNDKQSCILATDINIGTLLFFYILEHSTNSSSKTKLGLFCEPNWSSNSNTWTVSIFHGKGKVNVDVYIASWCADILSIGTRRWPAYLLCTNHLNLMSEFVSVMLNFQLHLLRHGNYFMLSWQKITNARKYAGLCWSSVAVQTAGYRPPSLRLFCTPISCNFYSCM